MDQKRCPHIFGYAVHNGSGYFDLIQIRFFSKPGSGSMLREQIRIRPKYLDPVYCPHIVGYTLHTRYIIVQWIRVRFRFDFLKNRIWINAML